MIIRTAKLSDHKLICKIAKQSPYTKDFSNMMFSGEACYMAGRIRVAGIATSIIGFTCHRLRTRDQVLVLYFVGVDASHRGMGVGQILLDNLWSAARNTVELKVMKDNPAVEFYRHRGFATIGEAYDGKALIMSCHRDQYRFGYRRINKAPVTGL